MSMTEQLVCVRHHGQLFFVPESLPDRRSLVRAPLLGEDAPKGCGARTPSSTSSLCCDPVTPASLSVDIRPVMATVVATATVLLVASALFRPHLLSFVMAP